MNEELKNLIQEKCCAIAIQHAEIIETNCKEVCAKFNCHPKDLIIEYHTNFEIIINIKAVHFKIENKFIIG